MQAEKIPFFLSFSIYGVPLLGVGCLLFGLGHPQGVLSPQAQSQEMQILADPNPRYNKIMAVFLNQEAQNVVRCRQKNQPAALAQAIDGYNVIALECTPAVFQTTHLPPSM